MRHERNFRENHCRSTAVAARTTTNIDAVLDVIATIAKAKDNVWVYRKAFDAYNQQTDQTFKQFYAEIVKLASMCEFGKDFCEDDEIRAVDQCLLIKPVLHTSDSIAKKINGSAGFGFTSRRANIRHL